MLAAAMMAAMLALTGGGAVVGSAVIARHRAQAAADLGALAAAGVLAEGPHAACGSAAEVIEKARASMPACTVDGLDVVVAVGVGVSFGRWDVGVAHATARAGPAASPSS